MTLAPTICSPPRPDPDVPLVVAMLALDVVVVLAAVLAG